MANYVDKFDVFGNEVLVMGQPNNFAGRNFGFIGDSMTYGATLTSPTTQRFSSILCKAVRANEYNVAQGGARFIQGDVMSFEEQVDYLYARQKNIDYMFFWGGYNDAFAGMSTSQMTIYASSLVSKIATLYPKCVIVWMGFNLPHGNFQQRIFWRYRNHYNNFQLFRADFPFINCTLGSLLVGASSAYYSTDLIHPNESGHALMATYLNSAIRGLSFDYVVNAPCEFYGTFTGNAPNETHGRFVDINFNAVSPTATLSSNKRYALATFNYLPKPFYTQTIGFGLAGATNPTNSSEPVYLEWDVDGHIYLITTSVIPTGTPITLAPIHYDWLQY